MLVKKELKIALMFFMLFAGLTPAFGQGTAGRTAAGEIREVKIVSPSLKENRLGDPAEQTIAVYLALLFGDS